MSGQTLNRRPPRVLRPLLVCALLVVSLACSGAPALPTGSPAGGKPVVVIQQPTAGALVAAGQNVVVSGAASDTIGVDRIALLVDGASVAGTPPGTPATLVPFSFTWLAVAGSHTLQVTAYRADGTASDPAIVQVTVGAATSALPGASFITFAPGPTVSQPSAPGPQRTRRPRRSRMPSVGPTATAPTSTTAPTATPTYAPTETPTTAPTPTIDPSGTAPDDSALEPHAMVLVASDAACPPGPPSTAVSCITEQISAPGGDTTDQLYFVPLANTTYALRLTSCSDTSGATVFHYLDPAATYGCGQGFNLQMPSSPPAQSTVTVKFGTVAAQTYNLYQFTVYQCAFANCGAQ